MPGNVILPLPAPPDNEVASPTLASQVLEQQKKDDNPVAEEQSKVPIATHTRTIGIIYPPPDIRSIVDKTVQFVAKNGNDFVKRVLLQNAGNAKFNFLNSSDPYHAYYQHPLSEAHAEVQSAAQQPSSQQTDSTALELEPSAPAADNSEDHAKRDPAVQFRLPPLRKVLELPEAEECTVRLPEGITVEELDIIEVTAQFVARNGNSFLNELMNREMNNPQFLFLKPTHSMYMFFTDLAVAYSNLLMPPKGLTEKLIKSVADMTTVLERCLNRLEWESFQEQERQKAEDEIEQERIQMAMIEWHDFVVVETIDFIDDEDEDLPPQTTLEEVIRRTKVSTMAEEEVIEPGEAVEMEMDEEEVQLVEEGMRASSLEDVDGKRRDSMVIEEPEPPMRILKNWKRPEERILAERDPTKFVVSPITGELIPINEMSEHMRISLIDPKYKEQKDRMFAKIRETTLAQDDEISRNIVGLARTRPDIFGTTEEEVSNAVKAELEKKEEQPKQVIWDGHTGSIGRTANQATTQGINGEEQNEVAADNLPGPAAPPNRPGLPSIRPLPPPPGLALNLPRMPPTAVQYPVPVSGVFPVPPPRPPGMPMIQTVPPPPPPMQMTSGQQPMMVNRPPSVLQPIPVPSPPGSQFTPVPVTQPFVPLPIPNPAMPMMPPPPLMPESIPPPPPPEDSLPPLPE